MRLASPSAAMNDAPVQRPVADAGAVRSLPFEYAETTDGGQSSYRCAETSIVAKAESAAVATLIRGTIG